MNSARDIHDPAEEPDLTDDEVTLLFANAEFRSKIDKRIIEAEARGGAVPHDEFMAQLRERHLTLRKVTQS